jgi:hypothetical protein
MSVAGVGAIDSVGGGGAVYALSPYLNGVVRSPDAVTAAAAVDAVTAATTTSSVAATNAAAVAASAAANPPSSATPFANPAIDDIAQQTSINASLQGDAGLLVQSYGAVALLAGPLVYAAVYTPPVVPAIPPPAPVAPVARVTDPA